MRIVITGTNGFIGKNLLNELKDKHDVLEINEDIFEITDWYNEIYFKLNVFDPEVVFHVGACSDTLETDVNYMMIRNFEFTRRVAEWCQLLNRKFIYSSSAANYGTNEEYPSNLYGWSKYVAEQYVISNGGIALRYFNVYGPGEEHKGKMASVAFQMYQKHLRGEKVSLFPKKPLRDFVYVKDVVDANIFAHENYDTLKGHYYEVGSGEARGFEDVLKLMDIFFDYVDETLIPNGYQFYTCSNPDKWMKGWFPSWTLELGIKDYKEYLKK
jgi:ADP-L-glycero-D-manno-heptose 6-epimerase